MTGRNGSFSRHDVPRDAVQHSAADLRDRRHDDERRSNHGEDAAGNVEQGSYS